MSLTSGPLRAGLFLVAVAVAAGTTHGQDRDQNQDQAAEARNTATTPAPRDEEGWHRLHESFLDRARKGDVDLLFLGDSITQGWADNDVWRRHYGPRRAANFGIGGDRTQHVLWRIEHGELEGISPKVVVLMIGTNNLGSNTPDEIVAGITAIVEGLCSKLPEAKVLLLGVFPRGEKPGRPRELICSINDQIARLDDGERVHYLDIGKVFLEDDDTISREVMPDFLHLSHLGYMRWADAIEPTLWTLLDEPALEKTDAAAN